MTNRIREATVEEVVNQVLDECLGVDEKDITPNSKLAEDLDADSLDIVEVCMNIEERFSINIDDAEGDRLQTVQDLYDIVKAKQAKQ